MTADLDAILAKVQKLLNTEGRTPEEAAAYVNKAHAILAEYDLTIESVGQLKADPRTAVASNDQVDRTVEGKPDGWKADILRAVAELFDCRVITHWDMEPTKSGKYRRVYRYELVGFGHDLDGAHYAHSFLVGEVERQAKAHARPHWDAIRNAAAIYGISVHAAERNYVQDYGTHPLKAQLYFTKGAAEAIVEGLNRERWQRAAKRREEQASNPNALVVLKEAELDDYLGQRTYGDRWESVKASRVEQNARWEQEALARRKELDRLREEHAAGGHRRRNASCTSCDRDAAARPETEKQRAAREAREAREEARRDARDARAAAKVDWEAYYAGEAAGRDISIRPGVKSGSTTEDRIVG